ncbi:DUF11 domain-containing protein [Mycetocola lacteus]|uniref:DUF7927 domain-containing protein n=1 Tax=Mycetocola lacteus TaxID=76637 RepID=UPI0015FFEFAB|nr:DUF11 domain-containing protein [Mycetocola lacteus]
MRRTLAAAATLALGAGVLVLVASPAQAEQNEKYAYAATPDPGTNRPHEWYVYVKAGEQLRVQAGMHKPDSTESWDRDGQRAFYTITDPSGNLVDTNDNGYPENTPAAGGREAGISMLDPDDKQPAIITATAATEGVYRVAIRNFWKDARVGSFPWKIAVSENGVEHSGRVWTSRYQLIENWPPGPPILNHPARHGLDLDYWFVSDLGYKYKLALNGYVGWTSSIEASLLGNTDNQCVSLYRSVVDTEASTATCDDLYKLFFEAPAADLPATAKIATANASNAAPTGTSKTIALAPTPVEPKLTIDGFTSDGNAAAPKAGTFTYTLKDFAGNYTIKVDTDGDGNYDGPADILVNRSALGGQSDFTFDFDGLDKSGAVIPEGTTIAAKIVVSQYPELHFVFGDVEQLQGGMTLTRLNGATGPLEDRLYWNDVDKDGNALGAQTCSTTAPKLGDPANPAVNYDPNDPLVGAPLSQGGQRFWDTPSQACRNNNTADLGSYGNNKLLDTWTHANVQIESIAKVVGHSLQITKSADVASASQGDTVTYTLTMTNNGDAPASAATGNPAALVDDLTQVLAQATIDPASLAASISGAATTAPTLSGTELRWSGDLAPGATVTVTYTATITGTTAATVNNFATALREANGPALSGADCTAQGAAVSFNCAQAQVSVDAVTPTPTPTPSVTPDPTTTPDPTVTPDPTGTPDPTATAVPTVIPVPTATASADPADPTDPLARTGAEAALPIGIAALVLALTGFVLARRARRTEA